MPRIFRAMCGLGLMLMLSGCATMTGSSGSPASDLEFGRIAAAIPTVEETARLGRAAFCDVEQPIRWSDADSDETIVQAKAHNATGVKLCGWRSSSVKAAGLKSAAQSPPVSPSAASASE